MPCLTPKSFFRLSILLLSACSFQLIDLSARTFAWEWQVGFSKVDVTPTTPLRLSGYSNRDERHEGVVDTLHVRAMVLTPPRSSSSIASEANDRVEQSVESETLVLVSMDSILATADFTVQVAQWLIEEYGLPRSQLAISSTHSHAAPQLTGGLENLLAKPQSEQELKDTKAYTDRLSRAVQSAIAKAMANRRAAHLEVGQAEATFAVHRRVVRDGVWTGFGEQKDGQTDHRVRVMLAVDDAGKTFGGAYLYACHCTTLGPKFNQISGDWAGLSASRLETIYSGSVFLPVIGCGADANPNPRDGYEFAVQHATEMVDAVRQVVQSKERIRLDVDAANVDAQFGYAGISPDRPTDEYLESMSESSRSVDVAWAKHMQAVRAEMGRLPESYPMPIHTWQFGDQLSWVFLGGEVVVDYQFQIEKELPTENTWVAAYTDDVFAYVASEAMRSEGGYEVDASMLFYLQPGRWQSGTQALILRRVKEIAEGIETESGPLSPQEGLSAIRVPDDFRVELVAAEPDVADPINAAFAPDGSVWLVEMADYPLGNDGGGRVKRLIDSDADGVVESQLFLDGLNFPTSVFPWREGVIVIAAPNVIWAVDRDGDGQADEQELLLSGIHEANPQHRASGFELGLDGWLHFGAGDGTREIQSHRNGETFSVHGYDVAWNPDTGEIRTESGETQFVRARDDFGNWFGNSNSNPIFQYVIDAKYLRQRGSRGDAVNHLLTPATAPPVFPASETKERFNDLYAFNRYTSACSSIVVRVPDIEPATGVAGLICEPVHNLVARIQLHREGPVFKASRYPGDERFDFFTSTDSWSRPVRVLNAPDGSIWVIDMLRKVIEHPEWIPTAWQQSLNVRDGSGQGRIYRVFHQSTKQRGVPHVRATEKDVLAAFASDNGAVRDLALLQLLWNEDLHLSDQLSTLAASHASPKVRAAALGALRARDWLTPSLLVNRMVEETDENVIRLLIEFSEDRQNSELNAALKTIVARNLGPVVDLQWVLTAGISTDNDFGEQLVTIFRRSPQDPWVLKSLGLVENPQSSAAVLEELFQTDTSQDPAALESFDLRCEIAAQLFQGLSKTQQKQVVSEFLGRRPDQKTKAPERLSASELLVLRVAGSVGVDASTIPELSVLAEVARKQLSSDETASDAKIALLSLVGSSFSTSQQDISLLSELIQQQTGDVRLAAIRTARRVNSESVPEILTSAWSQLSPRERTAACSTFMSKREWVAEFVSALESETIESQDLDPATVQQLRGYWDRSLRTRCLTVFGKPTPRAEVVQTYLADLPTPKLEQAGGELFKQHCAACHQTQDGQPKIGPSLENLKHWTLQQWVTAVMDPNRNVEPKYFQSTILTEDDQVIAGIVVQENGQQVRVALPDGSLQTIPRDEIVEIRESKQSLMPEGFEDKITPEQLAKLLAFVRQM